MWQKQIAYGVGVAMVIASNLESRPNTIADPFAPLSKPIVNPPPLAVLSRQPLALKGNEICIGISLYKSRPA
jgi:hypothetical protein